MRLTEAQMKDLVQSIFNEWKKQGLVTFKTGEGPAFEHAMEAMRQEGFKMQAFEKEVRVMLDGLEAQTPQGFDRHKMFLLLRQRLAKEKGIIL